MQPDYEKLRENAPTPDDCQLEVRHNKGVLFSGIVGVVLTVVLFVLERFGVTPGLPGKLSEYSPLVLTIYFSFWLVLLMCGLYRILCYFRYRILVKGKIIRACSAFGRDRIFTFNDIVSTREYGKPISHTNLFLNDFLIKTKTVGKVKITDAEQDGITMFKLMLALEVPELCYWQYSSGRSPKKQ